MTVRLRPEADEEINEIIAYYNAQSADLGWAFFEELDNELTAIAVNPARCGWIDDRHRKCRLRRFPYVVVYQPGSVTWVIAVYHASRDQDYWRLRTT